MAVQKSRIRSALCVFVTTTALATVTACGEGLITYIPLDLDGGDGTGGANTADAGPDADEDAGPIINGGGSGCTVFCDGECVPLRPGDFEPARLVWFGPDESLAPPCPPQAPVHQFTWHAEPSIPAASCNSCTCGPSTGFCDLPSTITAHAASCAQVAGAESHETNPPENWTGECSADNPIPPGMSCNGQPCAQSVTIGPLSVTDEACAAFETSAPSIEPAAWTLTAKVCEGSAFGGCEPDEQCVPSRAEGFRQCVEMPGIHDCPAEGYTDRFVVYEDLDDSRHCSPCTCGAPEGSYCAAWISLYADAACTGQPSTNSAWSKGPSCHDMTPPLWTIGAKATTEPVYQPGTCEAHGGELEGEVILEGPRTLCCLP